MHCICIHCMKYISVYVHISVFFGSLFEPKTISIADRVKKRRIFGRGARFKRPITNQKILPVAFWAELPILQTCLGGR